MRRLCVPWRFRNNSFPIGSVAPGAKRRVKLKPGVGNVNSLKRVLADLDTVLHERGRLAIVAVLAAVEDLTFTELRDELAMTDGNLSVHLQKLEEKGYVGISKHFVGRRPQTTCRLTPQGRRAFTRYLDLLQAIVHQGRAKVGA